MRNRYLFICILISSISYGQFAQQAKLVSSDVANSDQLGYNNAVGIDGDYAVVGARYDDDGGNTAGSAYVFVRSGTSWSQQAKLNASDAAGGDSFGMDVKISGDYIIVGSPEDDDDGTSSGSAYIFVRSGSSWSQQAKLTADDAAQSDYFGYEVDIDGDYAIVGAHNEDANNVDGAGSAYIFVRSGTSWSQQAKMSASDAAKSDGFGTDVSISGSYAVIASKGEESSGGISANSGAAYVFVRSGTSWSQQAKLTASDAAEGDHFGTGASIDGDYVIVGGPHNDDDGTSSGSAYIFVRSGTSWSQQAKLTASDAAAGDNFGDRVSISGDYAIVSAHGDDDDGAAYVFKRSNTSWSQETKLLASDGDDGDLFGRPHLNGEYAIIDALGDGGVNNYGAAYIFYNDLTAPTVSSVSLASDNSTIAVTFSEAVYTTTDGSTALVVGDFVFSINGGTATLSSATPSSISISGNVYTLGIALSGTPNGSEVITVNPASSTAIYDAADNAATTSQSNNTATLNEKIAPTVSSVSSTTANGSYNADDVIAITVTFSESVTVSGTPQLTLETGAHDAVVNYSSGSGGNVLTFNYTVSSGQTSSDLDYKATNSLALNSGTIRDGAGNNATLTLASPGATNSLGANKALVIDTTAPIVSSVTSTNSNGKYGTGDIIAITVTFNEAVTVSGTPQLTLETGSSDAVVNYSSGSGGTTLTFNYTVSSGHSSSDLDYKATSSLALNSGTIRDGAGNNAVLTLASPGATNSLGANKALVIDTVAPTITITATDGSNAVSDGATTNDGTLSVTFTTSEATTTFAVGDITVSGGAISNFSANLSTVFSATFTPSGDGATTIDVAANTFTDAAGNNNTAASQFNWTYDSTAPTISSVSLAASNATIAVTMSEAVYTATGASTALVKEDFVFSISGGNATLSSSTPSSISISGNVYTLGINLSSNMVYGNEVLTVTPVANGIYDAAGNVASTSQSNNTATLNGIVQQLGSDIDGEAQDDLSGWSVSMNAVGDRVAIGATSNDGTASSAGHVRIYQYSSNAWSQLGSDINGEAGGDESGWSVSMNGIGDRVAIGAWGNDGTAGRAGHVRIYQYSSNAWSQLGSDIDGEAAIDFSGHSVSMNAAGDRVAIGALYNDGTADGAGHVRIYQYSSNAWSQLGSDIDGEAALDFSGYSVSMNAVGDRVAIGAHENDGTADGWSRPYLSVF